MSEKKSGSEKLLYCSFCGKSQHEVKKLIAGPSVFICDECIAVSYTHLVERPVLEVGPTEVDGTIEILRKQRVSFEPVDRAAASGDRVSIDFLGKKDGVPFQGGQGQEYQFVLGEGKMLACLLYTSRCV